MLMAKTNKKTDNKVTAIDTLKSVISSTEESLEVNKNIIDEIREGCKKQGIGLDAYLKVIKDAMEAEKVYVNKFGDSTTEIDHDKRLKAAMIGLELEGYIKAKGSVVDASKHTHVTYSWQPVQVINNGGLKRVDVE